jgi:hypothetical protein
MIVTGIEKKNVTVELNEGAINDIVERKIRNMFDLPEKAFIDNGYVWVEDSQDKFYKNNPVVREATLEDSAAFIVLDKLKNK